MSSYLLLGLPRGLFPVGLSVNILKQFLISSILEHALPIVIYI